MKNLIKLVILLLSSLSVILQAQENTVLSNLKNKKLSELPVNQRLFLHLNKTLFLVSDTIWFKGYSVQGPLQQPSNISQTMIVALLNGKNEVVYSDQFLIFEGTAEGQIPLSKHIGTGQFLLAAYGSNMLNQDLNCIFRTVIEIKATSPNKFNYSFGFNKPFYRPEDQVDMQVLAYDKNYKPLINYDLNYGIWNGEKKLDKGKLKTNTEGIATLNFPFVSEHPDEPIKIDVVGGSYEVPDSTVTYATSLVQALDVQLLPEGGHLVADLMQIVAFRSVNDRGLPVDIEGVVRDASGEVVTKFNTSHQGMGKFVLIPRAGEKYKLQINSPLLYSHEVAFPEVLNQGFALSYLGTRGGNAIFKVAKNFDGKEAITAVWQMDGVVVGTQTISLENEQMFLFPVRGLPEGIAKLTLFDRRGEPFAERLVFVRPSDKITTQLHFNSNKYFTRSKGVIDLEVLTADGTPIRSNLSVTITKIAEGINPLNPLPDIRDYTLFKSELSGSVYQPAQYFDTGEDDNLLDHRTDLVMLTHGWRKYDWYNELCHKIKPGYVYYDYDLYRGVVTKGNSVVPHASVEVYSWGKGIASTFSKADEIGRFWVKPEFTEKSNPTIIISAEKKNEFSRSKLNMEDREQEMRDSIVKLFLNELMPYVYHSNVDVHEKTEDLDTLFKIWETKYLTELTVFGSQEKDRVSDNLKRFGTGSTYSLKQEDFGQTVTDMESLIYQLGAGLYIENDQVVKTSRGGLVAIPIMLDGIQLRDGTFSEIAYLSSDMIEGIAYVKSNMLLFELDSGGEDGALLIWTLPGKNVPAKEKEKKNKFTSKRYSNVCTFYNPKYSTPKEKANPEPDKRVTLLWNNAVFTDSLGRAVIEFYSGDLKGDFLVNIQGISRKNGPVFKETIFSVN